MSPEVINDPNPRSLFAVDGGCSDDSMRNSGGHIGLLWWQYCWYHSNECIVQLILLQIKFKCAPKNLPNMVYRELVVVIFY